MIRIIIKTITIERHYYKKNVTIGIVRETIYIKSFTMDITIEIIIIIFVNT